MELVVEGPLVTAADNRGYYLDRWGARVPEFVSLSIDALRRAAFDPALGPS